MNKFSTFFSRFRTAGWIVVDWDGGSRFSYPYGSNGEYSIVVCDSPRLLDDQLIAVGCLVSRGMCVYFYVRHFLTTCNLGIYTITLYSTRVKIYHIPYFICFTYSVFINS